VLFYTDQRKDLTPVKSATFTGSHHQSPALWNRSTLYHKTVAESQGIQDVFSPEKISPSQSPNQEICAANGRHIEDLPSYDPDQPSLARTRLLNFDK
jgi:hypothetical protein